MKALIVDSYETMMQRQLDEATHISARIVPGHTATI